MAGRRDLEKVDRGALEKVGHPRRRRGIMVVECMMFFWCGESPQRKGTAGTTLVQSQEIPVPVNDEPMPAHATNFASSCGNQA
jgi:hypothetical protein